jgi:hypothetical protein
MMLRANAKELDIVHRLIARYSRFFREKESYSHLQQKARLNPT